jgi:hypothetical protein
MQAIRSGEYHQSTLERSFNFSKDFTTSNTFTFRTANALARAKPIPEEAPILIITLSFIFRLS